MEKKWVIVPTDDSDADVFVNVAGSRTILPRTQGLQPKVRRLLRSADKPTLKVENLAPFANGGVMP